MDGFRLGLATLTAFIGWMLFVTLFFRWTGNKLDDGEFKIIVGMVFGAICLTAIFFGASYFIGTMTN